MDNNNQEQGKEAAKVLAGFDNTVKKLTAIVNGPDNLKVVRKVAKDSVESLVQDLFKEETEATILEVKNDLKSLLKNYVTLNNTIREEKAKLAALEVAKKKEFNAAANKLFTRIDGVDVITREYYSAFTAAAEATTEEVIVNQENTEDNE